MCCFLFCLNREVLEWHMKTEMAIWELSLMQK